MDGASRPADGLGTPSPEDGERRLRDQEAPDQREVAHAGDTVEAEVRELVPRRGLDPVEDRVAMRRLVAEQVLAHGDAAVARPGVGGAGGARRSRRSRPLQRHLDDPEVEEISDPGATAARSS